MNLNQLAEVNITYKNFSQKLEMQIPQENTYTGMTIMPRQEDNLNEFLKNHFNFPSNNLNQIKEFICKDLKMEKIIRGLPKIIAKEFQNAQITLDFMKYTSPNEIILKIAIRSQYDGETSSKKKDAILDELYSKYESPKQDYFITMEF